jgi:tetratricopeptide (TPR) repeat protein
VRIQVGTALAEWVENARDARFLLEGKRLANAEDLLAKRRGNLTAKEAAYVEASTAHVQAVAREAWAKRGRQAITAARLGTAGAVCSLLIFANFVYFKFVAEPNMDQVARTQKEANDEWLQKNFKDQEDRQRREELDRRVDAWASSQNPENAGLNDIHNLDQNQNPTGLQAKLQQQKAQQSAAQDQQLAAFRDVFHQLGQTDLATIRGQGDVSDSLEKIGDMELDQTNISEALQDYQGSLALRRKLVQADPHNTTWQYKESLSLERVGEVENILGKSDVAQPDWVQGQAIIKRLIAQDPDNADYKSDLQWFDAHVASPTPTPADSSQMLPDTDVSLTPEGTVHFSH